MDSLNTNIYSRTVRHAVFSSRIKFTFLWNTSNFIVMSLCYRTIIMNILERNCTSHYVITWSLCQYMVSRCICQGFRMMEYERDEECAVTNKSAELKRSQSRVRGTQLIAQNYHTMARHGNKYCDSSVYKTKETQQHWLWVWLIVNTAYRTAPIILSAQVSYLLNVLVIVLFARVQTLPMRRCHLLEGTLNYIKMHIFLDYISMVGFRWPFW